MSQPPEYPGQDRLKRMAQRASGSGPDRSGGGAYEGAFEAVGAILIATLLGYWFDEHYGTTPTGVLVGAGIGFAAFVLRLVRLGRQIHPPGTADVADVAESDLRRADGDDGPTGAGLDPGRSAALDDDPSERPE